MKNYVLLNNLQAITTMKLSTDLKTELMEAQLEYWINYNYTHPDNEWIDMDGEEGRRSWDNIKNKWSYDVVGCSKLMFWKGWTVDPTTHEYYDGDYKTNGIALHSKISS